MEELHNRRAIVDRRKLQAAAEAIIAQHGRDEAALRPALAGLAKQALAAGREEIRKRLEANASGAEVVRAQSWLVDQLLRVLYDVTTQHVRPNAKPGAADRLGIVAVGGYGRGELAPYSDVDLLFLLPPRATKWPSQVVEFLLYLLWDTGLKIGHATRNVADCLKLATTDLTIRTGLLEARYLWGDQTLFLELKQRFNDQIVAATGHSYVEAKLAERDARHQRMGDSRYVVEPNIKEGKGGLRDLHTLYWIAKYLYRVADLSELVQRGVLTAEEHRIFAKAQEFLWRVRCHLHVISARPEERLTVDVQGTLATRLGYTDHAGARGIERFMKHYYLVAKDVGDLTRIFCAALEDQHRRKPRLRLPSFGLRKRQIVEGFVVEGDRLAPENDNLFAREPVAMLRLFAVAQEHGLDIHPRALRAITQNLKRIDRKTRESEEANRLFMAMLTSRKDPETTLRRLNEAGVFGRFMPDFGRVVAQTQHDMYHVYTVDEHTIRAIGLLHKIEAGELAEDHPLSNVIVHKVLSRRVLYLAVLFHDIAKGRGGDHSQLGEQVAQRLCPRLGLSEAETETVAWLVRWHLAMSFTAFKRDLDDPKTVADFVALVQSPERLRLLLVLTVADIRAVGPAVWNGWKGQLLRDLYYRAEEAMLGGLAMEGHKSRVAAAKDALRKELADWPAAAIDKHLARGPDAFWLSADAKAHARWARMMMQADREGAPLAIDTRPHTFHGVTELTVYTADHAGLFSRIAGAIALCGVSIVDARIFTTQDGMAIDTFQVQELDGTAVQRPDKLAKLSASINRTLAGDVKPHEELPHRHFGPSRAKVYRVAPRVLIDNNVSTSHTVIEVNGRDRPGLLFDLTRAIFRLNLTITTARIATYGAQAVDVFYVKDLFGHKVAHERKLSQIEARLLEALAEPEEPAQREKEKVKAA
jgi:[protein-PII] uridylyltransferase